MLLVEADEAQRAGLGRILRGEGHQVLEASCADDAVAMTREFSPHVVVVGDGPLGVAGSSVLHALEAGFGVEAPPTVLLTASQTMATTHTERGALGLSKPFRVEDLLSAVRRFQRTRGPDA